MAPNRTLLLCVCGWMLLTLPGTSVADTVNLVGHIQITGVAVSSACSITVSSSHSSRDGVVDFGVYNKATHRGGQAYPFSLDLYEEGAMEKGCTALLAGGDFVSIVFGDSGSKQLDEVGVITSGAGDNIRIEVVATDSEASSHHPITTKNNVIRYNKYFAARGTFGFSAAPQGLEEAMAGRYSGKLSILVTYK